jgi:hypothetical protein
MSAWHVRCEAPSMTALRFLSFTLAGPLGLALFFGCGPLTPTGQLGNGQFTYVCSPGSVDTACSSATASPEGTVSFEDTADSLGTTTLPHVIAVGAAFTITYSAIVDGYDSIQGDSGYGVTPASSEIAAPNGDSIIAKRAGYIALLAENSASQTVDDFVLVNLQPIASLAPAQDDVVLAPGSVEQLSVTAEDAAGETLGGRLACAWTFTKGTSALAFQGSTNGAAVNIQGLADGDATANVTCGGVTAEVAVHVTGTASPVDGGLGDGQSDGGDHE